MLDDPVPVWRPVRLALFEGSSAGGACTGKAYVGLKLWWLNLHSQHRHRVRRSGSGRSSPECKVDDVDVRRPIGHDEVSFDRSDSRVTLHTSARRSSGVHKSISSTCTDLYVLTLFW
jgi:hypothetical protein